MTDVVKKMFVKNKKAYADGRVRNIADSFISVVKKETDKEKENRPAPGEGIAPLLSNEQIVQVLADLFGAGLDTSAVTLYWCPAYLIKYPEMQRQLHEELDNVIGRERFPTVEDLTSLPLLQAAVYDLLTVTSVVPLPVPRSTTMETNIRGFRVPKDTVVFVKLWSVHRDPEDWKDPDVFHPSRFLDSADHVIYPKLLGSFLPFSGGSRKCPGEAMAVKTVSVFLGALLHSFRFTQDGLPAEYQGINLKGQYGLSLMPEKFYVKIEERH